MKEAHSDLESAKQEAIAIANTLTLINKNRGHVLCSAESFLALRSSQLVIMALEKAQVVLIHSGEEADGLKEVVSMDSTAIVIADSLVANSQLLEASLKSMAGRLASKPLYKLWVEKAYVSAAEAGYWIGILKSNLPEEEPEEEIEKEKIDTHTGDGEGEGENSGSGTGEGENTGSGTAQTNVVMTVSKENQPPSEPGNVNEELPSGETNQESPSDTSENKGVTTPTSNEVPAPTNEGPKPRVERVKNDNKNKSDKVKKTKEDKAANKNNPPRTEENK